MNGTRTLRRELQTATQALHEKLDRQIEAFDLASLRGYRCFLKVHLLSALKYQEPLHEFCIEQLQHPVPDYALMLREDLAELGEVDRDAQLAPPWMQDTSTAQGAGLAYVILGSRLGTATLKKRFSGKLTEQSNTLSFAYMSEPVGLVCWRKFLTWCDTVSFDQSETDAAIDAAKAAFDLFRNAATHVAQEDSAQ